MRNYTGKFNIIVPDKPLIGIVPLKVTFETIGGIDDNGLDILTGLKIDTTFNIEQLTASIHTTRNELLDENSDQDPDRHPDIATMKTALQALETKISELQP